MLLLLQAGAALSLTLAVCAQESLPPPIMSDFVVSGVAIQRSGEITALDREQALAEGHRRALQMLLRRLLPSDIDPERITPQEIDNAGLVEGYDIEQENSTATRYNALVTYRFRPAAVRALVQAAIQRSTMPSIERSSSLQARIFLSDLEEWIEVRKRLASIPILLSTTVIGLNRTQAVVALALAGSTDQARQALARRDLVLEAVEDGYIIHLQAGPGRPPALPNEALPSGDSQALPHLSSPGATAAPDQPRL